LRDAAGCSIQLGIKNHQKKKKEKKKKKKVGSERDFFAFYVLRKIFGKMVMVFSKIQCHFYEPIVYHNIFSTKKHQKQNE
jgi:hypothetical protein